MEFVSPLFSSFLPSLGSFFSLLVSFAVKILYFPVFLLLARSLHSLFHFLSLFCFSLIRRTIALQRGKRNKGADSRLGEKELNRMRRARNFHPRKKHDEMREKKNFEAPSSSALSISIMTKAVVALTHCAGVFKFFPLFFLHSLDLCSLRSSVNEVHNFHLRGNLCQKIFSFSFFSLSLYFHERLRFFFLLLNHKNRPRPALY
jgi:hypothetical protein